MSTESSQNNKRIAKNTLLLYFRMLLTMVVSLYTSRVVLGALGVEDYGIYNVVGGVVAMFSMLSGSLSAAISRFITFELGKKNHERLHKVFCTSINVQLILILILFVLLETVGLWFLNYKMVIPEGRLSAANWVFQFSIITFAVNLYSVPYNAAIVAHEKMSAFAYISIIEVSAKLLVAFLILKNPFDRLVFYGMLLLIIGLIIRYIYGNYCIRHFDECKYRFVWHKSLVKEMFGFAGWNFFGAGSWQLMNQGVNLLMNMFFGVTVNAARGIAVQVDTAVLQFVNNFTMAVNPQITKSYASGDKCYLYSLMFRGSKFSYFLIMFFALPIMFQTEFILDIWLKHYPEHTASFIRLALIVSMLHVISNTMVTAMLATGNIKKYQIIVGGLGMLVFPLAMIAFYLGCPPEAAYYSTLIVFVLQLLIRLKLLNQMVGMPIGGFLKNVLLKILAVTVISILPLIVLLHFLGKGWMDFIIVCSTSVIISLVTISFIGLTSSEREFVLKEISKVYKKVKNK